MHRYTITGTTVVDPTEFTVTLESYEDTAVVPVIRTLTSGVLRDEIVITGLFREEIK